MPPRTKKPVSEKSTITEKDLYYLAGIFDSTFGMRSINKNSALAIASTKDWPESMAKKFGGSADYFESRNGKPYWGWYVSLQRRLELIRFLKTEDLIQSLDTKGIQSIEAKLERAINNEAVAD